MQGINQLIIWIVIGLILCSAIVASTILGWRIFSQFVDINVPIMHPRRGIFGIAKVVGIVLAVVLLILLLVSLRLKTI